MLHVVQAQKPHKLEIDYGKAREVYHQMLPDFPSNAIQWVRQTHWLGPVHIPLDSVDTRNRKNWRASQEPEKVAFHQQQIRDGKSKPIIVGVFPEHSGYVIIDAHHRYLAYEALDQDPLAYVGVIEPEHVEAAMRAHSMQYSGSSKIDGPDESGANAAL